MGIEYAIIVRDKTRLESLIERFNTKAQAKFYIESLGADFEDYLEEHEIFYDSLSTLQKRLSQHLKNKILDRSHISNYLFADNNLIVVIGRDGLVANTAKYAKSVPIVAVNPDKERYDGVLLPFDQEDFVEAVQQVKSNAYTSREVRFAQARLNDGQRLLGFNDLFIGAATHVSARYKINFRDQEEEHSSSGIIVSTQAGATGWLSSIFNMAYGVANLFEKDLSAKHPKLKDDQLLFAVREPFASIRTQTGITTGLINPNKPLVIESYMPTNGVIFSDGIERDFLRFNSGAIATIGLAKEIANLVQKEGA